MTSDESVGEIKNPDSGVNCCKSFFAAVKNNHLDCLKRLHENGFPWHPDTTYRAVESGNIECLKYIHENGCSWSPYTTRGAATSGRLECLKYIYEYCGDEISWEDTGLEGINWSYRGALTGVEECREYIEEVKEGWKNGFNKTACGMKPAKK